MDTNRLTDLFKDEPEVARWVSVAEYVYLPFVVLAEFEFGIAGGTRSTKNRQAISRLTSQPNVGVVFPDRVTLQVYGTVAAALKRIGKPIPTNDIWIASLCIQHDLILLTRDAHFKHVSEVRTL